MSQRSQGCAESRALHTATALELSGVLFASIGALDGLPVKLKKAEVRSTKMVIQTATSVRFFIQIPLPGTLLIRKKVHHWDGLKQIILETI